MNESAISRWHNIVKTRDAGELCELLADDVGFHSPVVHTPQIGKEVTKMYLSAAIQVLGNSHFKYVREIVSETDAVLEFETEIDRVVVNGVDMIKWNDAEQIKEFKVMIRPLKAINLIHQKMIETLQRTSNS